MYRRAGGLTTSSNSILSAVRLAFRLRNVAIVRVDSFASMTEQIIHLRARASAKPLLGSKCELSAQPTQSVDARSRLSECPDDSDGPDAVP